MGRKNARAKRKCERKVTYGSFGAARASARKLSEQGGGLVPMKTYRCGDHWHLARSRRPNHVQLKRQKERL